MGAGKVLERPAAILVLMAVALQVSGVIAGVSAQLSSGFYSEKCPQVEQIVRRVMEAAVQKDPRMAASILRLHFHDCFVQGCDASVLLDDTPSLQGEKNAGPNNNSLRGFEVIDGIKAQVEAACPDTVSCSDILALASRDGVALLQGPSWDVPLGRRDARTASLSGANTNIPAPNFTLAMLLSKFNAQGLSLTDLIALSGSHTIGNARCVSFRQRLYNQANTGKQDPTLDAQYAQQLKGNCPRSGNDNALFPLDVSSPTVFNNKYFTNLQAQKGLLSSDEVLLTTAASSAQIVNDFAKNQDDFFENFKISMVKMSSIGVLTGSNGEIRKNCRKIN